MMLVLSLSWGWGLVCGSIGMQSICAYLCVGMLASGECALSACTKRGSRQTGVGQL